MRGARIVVADDSLLLRESLVTLLRARGLDVVATASTVDELLLAVERARPTVVLADIRMPPTHTDEGLRAAAILASRHPGIGVLVLSQHLEPAFAMRLVEEQTAGRGYMLKDRVASVDALVAAIATVAHGGCVIDPAVIEVLMRVGRPANGLGQLTVRERDILALMAEGRSNTAIAGALHLSPKTIETHVGSIFRKLCIPADASDHRRVLAVLRWLSDQR